MPNADKKIVNSVALDADGWLARSVELFDSGQFASARAASSISQAISARQRVEREEIAEIARREIARHERERDAAMDLAGL